MVNSILVLGGGSAGFLAAITLKHRLPSVTVTVLRSKDLGIIGVGEGTTVGVTSHLHGYLGLDPAIFHREAEPVWKLGIRFLWGKRPYFDYAFAQQLDAKLPFLQKPNGFYVDQDMTDYAPYTAMMSRNKVLPKDATGKLLVDGAFAYHLENETFVRWLEKTAAIKGVIVTDGTVTAVQQGEQGITGLVLEDGRNLTADLFVDASGFRSVLLRNALNEPYVDYSSSLWCDRAVIGGWDRQPSEPIQPFTVAETMNAGWAWRIDHERRINRGYVFSSRYLSDDLAETEFREKNPLMGSTRVIRFSSGRLERAWVKNVVAVGNAFGFVEPLEATSLATVCSFSRNLAEILADGDLVVRESQRSLFNHVHTRMFDAIRWFLSLHYKFNSRLSTPFWNDCLDKVDVTGVLPLIEYFHENGPSALFRTALLDQSDPFGVEGYLVLLVGQQVQYLQTYQPTVNELQAWQKMRQQVAAYAERSVSMEQALPQLKSANFRWRREWFTGVGTPSAVGTAGS